jgi:hypothetical protein
MQAEAGNAPRNRAGRARDAVLVASLLPLGLKAIDYALIGSLLPLLCWALGIGLVIGALAGPSPRLRRICTVAWATALLLWALARLVVFALYLALGIPEAHVDDQMNATYVLISLLHLAAAVWLLTRRGRGARA